MKFEGSKLVVLALDAYEAEQVAAAKEHHERGRARAFAEVFFVLEKLSNGDVSLAVCGELLCRACEVAP
jgi:hypothetical protein